MARRVIAIGDIHGCARALETLLEAINPQPEDILVPLGDYIDRGSNSRDVIQQLIALSRTCQLRPILGNHEEMFLEVLVGRADPARWLRYGAPATLDSYGFSGDLAVIPQEHVKFLQDCLDWFETETHFFVHANYLAEKPLSEQPASVLRWRTLQDHTPGPHCSGKLALLGHTADRTGEIFSLRHLKCIDTYCYGGKWLTALDVDSGRIWQANDRGQLTR